MHAQIIDGTVAEYPIYDLRQYFPNASLPADLTSDEALPEGYVYVQPGAYPVVPLTYKASLSGVPVLEAGRWVDNYVLEPLSAAELEQAVANRINALVAQIQQRLDDFARARSFDSILSACTYINSVVPTFKADAMYAMQMRDMTWDKAHALLAEFQAGQRPIDTTYEDIAGELPPAVWPASIKTSN